MFEKHVTKRLTAYLHRELPEEQMRGIESHLRQCDKCRTAYEAIQFASRMATTLSTASAPDSVWTNVWAARGRAPRTKRPAFQFAVAGAVMVALLLVAGGLYLRRSGPETSRTGTTPAVHVDDNSHEVRTTVEPPPPRPNTESPSWHVRSVRGAPRVGTLAVGAEGRLRTGEALQTDASSEARIKIADIGELHVNPNTIVRLIETRPGQHRIALDRGKLEARTIAPPRVFVVDTPTAAAVDLGCRYTLEVEDDGGSVLHVLSGVVALQAGQRETVVPAGAYCRTRPQTGPGTPWFQTASETFRSALNRVDFTSDPDDRAEQLETVLAESRPQDALSLWSLLPRLDASLRGPVFDRLAEVAPPPAGITREGVIALDSRMLSRWKDPVSKLWQSESQRNRVSKGIQLP